MKILRRSICLLMIISLISVNFSPHIASAYNVVDYVAPTMVGSWSIGGKTHLVIYDDGNAYVRGTGASSEYTSSTVAWKDYKHIITNVTIDPGVTLIGSGIFADSPNLVSVNFGTLQYISANAFSNCVSLRYVDLPEELIQVGANAFSGCTSLKYIRTGSTRAINYATAFNNLPSLVEVQALGYVSSASNAVFNSSRPDSVIYYKNGTANSAVTNKVGMKRVVFEGNSYSPYSGRFANDYTIKEFVNYNSSSSLSANNFSNTGVEKLILDYTGISNSIGGNAVGVSDNTNQGLTELTVIGTPLNLESTTISSLKNFKLRALAGGVVNTYATAKGYQFEELNNQEPYIRTQPFTHFIGSGTQHAFQFDRGFGSGYFGEITGVQIGSTLLPKEAVKVDKYTLYINGEYLDYLPKNTPMQVEILYSNPNISSNTSLTLTVEDIFSFSYYLPTVRGVIVNKDVNSFTVPFNKMFDEIFCVWNGRTDITEYVTIEGNKVTIDPEYINYLPDGNYTINVGLEFDIMLQNRFTLQVTGNNRDTSNVNTLNSDINITYNLNSTSPLSIPVELDNSSIDNIFIEGNKINKNMYTGTGANIEISPVMMNNYQAGQLSAVVVANSEVQDVVISVIEDGSSNIVYKDNGAQISILSTDVGNVVIPPRLASRPVTNIINTNSMLSQIALPDTIVSILPMAIPSTVNIISDNEIVEEYAFTNNNTYNGSSLITPTPTEEPTPVPTEEPTPVPTEEPTPVPTEVPTSIPTPVPTEVPTGIPTPTEEPTEVPTSIPTPVPTEVPTGIPTPTEEPTPVPTEVPTSIPTPVPTEAPTTAPTEVPTTAPTEVPTKEPTPVPTEAPTTAPTEVPTSIPTPTPTEVPTSIPTPVPTEEPTPLPTEVPVVTTTPTEVPTSIPTPVPTEVPVVTPTPTEVSVVTPTPTEVPTSIPTPTPTEVPTSIPTPVPTEVPTSVPTVVPTEVPTSVPTPVPTEVPTAVPTEVPASIPTPTPTEVPIPTPTPTEVPIVTPTPIIDPIIPDPGNTIVKESVILRTSKEMYLNNKSKINKSLFRYTKHIVTYKSSDTSVAKVSKYGNITPIALGQTTITTYYNINGLLFSHECLVTVIAESTPGKYKELSNINILNNTITINFMKLMYKGRQLDIKPEVEGNVTVDYIEVDPNIATIKDGIITAHNKGTTSVIVKIIYNDTDKVILYNVNLTIK